MSETNMSQEDMFSSCSDNQSIQEEVISHVEPPSAPSSSPVPDIPCPSSSQGVSLEDQTYLEEEPSSSYE